MSYSIYAASFILHGRQWSYYAKSVSELEVFSAQDRENNIIMASAGDVQWRNGPGGESDESAWPGQPVKKYIQVEYTTTHTYIVHVQL